MITKEFTQEQMNLLVISVLAKLSQNNKALDLLTNGGAHAAVGEEQRELKEILGILTRKED